MRHFLSLQDVPAAELQSILDTAAALKATPLDWNRPPQYAGSVMGMLFEKSSLRTRVSFQAAIAHLGGSSIFLGAEAGWGTRESVADFGRVLSQYLDVLVFRGKSHPALEELASFCTCPVINGLTDQFHPCQAVADVMTAREICGRSNDIQLAYVGDCNNVARSLAIACAMSGIQIRIACPREYQFSCDECQSLRSKFPDATIQLTDDPQAAITGADVVYTDVWASMGQESETQERRKEFQRYQINQQLMQLAKPNAGFLHCLPARRGEEVTDEVIDSPRSFVVQQAGNRLHAQKAILHWLLSDA